MRGCAPIFFFSSAKSNQECSCVENLVHLWNTPELIGHAHGVLICQLSGKTRYQVLVADLRLKPEARSRKPLCTEVIRKDPNQNVHESKRGNGV